MTSHFEAQPRNPALKSGFLLALLVEMTAGLLAFCLLPSPAFAAFNLKYIRPASYDAHFNPGEQVTFTVIIKNNESTAQFAEVDVTLVNQATGAELTLTPVITATIGAFQEVTLTGTYPTVASATTPSTLSGATNNIPEGSYTVTFPLFDGNGDKSDSVRGTFPLHVGTETESLRVFPEALNLGTIPPGRYMHPVPIEIRYSYFQYNRLRQDQPFAIRIYTDNAARYEGVPHALKKPSPAGLVSMNGRYVIPVKCWTLNFGPDIQETGWDAPLAGPPPVDDDDYWLGPPLLEGVRSYGSANWVRIPDLVDMTPNPITWRRLVGQDQYDNRFVADSNVTGDFTLKSPFTLYLATEAGPTTVEGTYVANLVVELWSP